MIVKKKKKKNTLLISTLTILIGLAGYAALDWTAPFTDDSYLVTRVVDGDTIVVEINGTEEKVRLIGIDTPESVHPDADRNVEYGKIASAFTEEQIEGKLVSLEFDVQERDKYGRLLAYVYLDDKMFNEMLLAEGHAMVATYPPNVKYVDRFLEIQSQAREAKLGLWADSSYE